MMDGDNMNIFKKMFDHEYKELKRFEELADKVLALDSEMSKLTPLELKAKTSEFKSRLSEGETLDDILVEAFVVLIYQQLNQLPHTYHYVILHFLNQNL